MRGHGAGRAGLAAALLLVGAALGPGPAPAQSLAAAFDYTLPERFEVPAIAGGGAAATAGEVYTALAISPASWTVHFDACASTGAIVAWEWRIEGQLVDTMTSCDGFTHDFPAEGRYDVSLTVLDGLAASDATALEVVVDDLLIVALGDSYASGEGVPDEPVDTAALDLARTRQTARDSARAARDAAQASFEQALSDYEVTIGQLDAALAAQSTYLAAVAARQAACPLPPGPCANALAAEAAAASHLASALADIGLSQLDVDETSAIQDAIANLRSLAEDAVGLARDARDAAVAALSAAEAELDAAIAALEPAWQNERCHRSSRSWQVEVARRLAEADARSSVTLVHLACSGATIQTGLIGAYGGIAPVGDELLAPQVDRARELACGAACDAGDREVDALLVSIGGNDVNFSEVIAACVLGEPCFDNPVLDGAAESALELFCSLDGIDFADSAISCLPERDAAETIVVDTGLDASTVFFEGFLEPPECGDPGVELDGCNGLDDLPANYAKLHDRLVAAFGASIATRVHLTGYPQLTLDASRDPCGWNPQDPLATQLRNLPGVSTPEMVWAGGTVTPALLGTMSSAATAFGWSFVDDHVSVFEPHGYCSTDGWIVRLQDSPLIEASPFGTAHPTEAGQLAYADAVFAAVPAPRAPAAALATLAALGLLARRAGRGAAG